jgi:ribosomal protein L13E
MVTSLVAASLEEVILARYGREFAADEGVALSVSLRKIKWIGGDVDQARLQKMERCIEQRGHRPIQELASRFELLVEPVVVLRLFQMEDGPLPPSWG